MSSKQDRKRKQSSPSPQPEQRSAPRRSARIAKQRFETELKNGAPLSSNPAPHSGSRSQSIAAPGSSTSVKKGNGKANQNMNIQDGKRNIVAKTLPDTSRPSQSTDNQASSAEVDSCLKLNAHTSDCLLCSNKIKPGGGIILSICKHTFCRDCLRTVIESQKDLACFPCPVSAKSNCGGSITDTEVRNIVSPNVYEEYLDRSLAVARKQMENVFECASENCKGWCEYEVGRKTFICPICNKNNCLECKACHDGLSCDVYKCFHTTGQLDKAHEMLIRQDENGWNQLDAIMKAKLQGSASADLQMIPEQIDNIELLESCAAFHCSICMTDGGVGEGVIIKECLHVYCKECLSRVIELSEEVRVKCPYVKGDYMCSSFLQCREIKAIVSPAIYDKYLERSLKLGESSMENSFHCKTPDCRGWCVYEEGVKDFKCEICSKISCIPCSANHEGMSCADFTNRLEQNNNDILSAEAVQAMIDAGNAMRCPKCKIPVEKIAGCDWVICGVCRTEICWITKGPRWGPRGYGDISGGCKCRLYGFLCHPKCRNCH